MVYSDRFGFSWNPSEAAPSNGRGVTIASRLGPRDNVAGEGVYLHEESQWMHRSKSGKLTKATTVYAWSDVNHESVYEIPSPLNFASAGDLLSSDPQAKSYDGFIRGLRILSEHNEKQVYPLSAENGVIEFYADHPSPDAEKGLELRSLGFSFSEDTGQWFYFT